ncbi:MAG: hypothetical protein PVJ39_17065 [Gammaproteobacteria bacterium]
MSKRVWLIVFLFSLFLAFAGCGGGSGGGNDGTGQVTGTTISGEVSVVANQVALFENKTLMTRLATLLVPDLQAAVTGLTQLPNATVELIRIDDNGDQVGGVLATATTDDNGAYVLETTETLSSDLVVQITDNASNKVRAIALSETVDINPVTEYVVQQILASIADPNTNYSLDSVSADTMSGLIDFVETLDVDVTNASSLDDAITTIDTTAATQGIDNEVDNGLYTISLAGRTATSIMTSSGCANGTEGGFAYSYTSDGITMTGSDTFNSDGAGNCTLGAEETFSLTHAELESIEDIVYCGSDHLCTYADLNREVSGVDGDGRNYTYTVSHVRDSNTITAVKSVDGETFIEVITLDPAPSIVGAWELVESSTSNTNVIVFVDDTRYVLAHTNNSEPDAVIGATVPVSAEYGTYTWNPLTGVFTATALGQSDGEGGLSNPVAEMSIAVNGSNLTLSDANGFSADLPKISSASDIIGAWILSDGSTTDYHVLVFLNETDYLIAHTDNTEFDTNIGAIVPVSAETGTYTWNSTSGAFSVTVSGQSDGQGGLSNPVGDLTVAVDGANLTITDTVDGSVVFTRVE